MTAPPPARPLLVTRCRQLVTLSGPARPRVGPELASLGIVPNGALLVAEGRIVAAGPETHVCAQAGPDVEIVDAGRGVVLPGFVDAHTHPVFGGTRLDEYEQRARGATYEAIAEAGGGIRSTVRRTRGATPEALLTAARRYRSWFLSGGTTTIEAKSGYGLSLADELKLLTVIDTLDREGPLRYVPTFLGAHEVPDEYRDDRAAYVDLVIDEMLPAVAAQGVARYCDVFCEPTVFDVASARRVLTKAKALGLGLRVHADQLSRSGAAELAAELGAVTADHLEQTDADGIAALGAARVQPVLLPASVYALGKTRYPAARAMIDAGLAVVVATDFNPGSSPTASMPMVLSLASTQLKMTPAEAITACTVNAAWSLGLGGDLGSLEVGKRANFVVHACEDYRELAYFFGMPHTRDVFIDGRRVWCRDSADVEGPSDD
ncbi:MAG: imidazolonepropionase [Vicinamibacterales bacterium]